MRAHASNGHAARSAHRSGHGLLGAVRDFFSPTLACEECGIEIKRYRCERTGEVHTIPADRPVNRWSVIEIGYLCPECGAKIWMEDTTSTVYPMF